MADSIDQTLGLSDRTFSRMVRAKNLSMQRGVKFYKRPGAANVTFAIAGTGEVITTYLYFSDRWPRMPRTAVVYTRESTGDQIHKASLSYWSVRRLTIRRQIKKILRIDAGLRVD